MGRIQITVTQAFGSQVIEKQNREITIAPLNVGKRQMLEAAESTSTTATDDIVLTDESNVIQTVDPNGAARTITLPAIGLNNHGFLIINIGDSATEIITVNNALSVEIGKVYPGGAGWFISNGANWKSAGLGTTDIATKRIAVWRILSYGDGVTVGDGKDYFTVPTELNGYNLVDFDIAVDTESSSGLPTVQLRNVTDSVDMLSTKASIDEGELNSYTSVTQPVIDSTKDDVATGDRLACDVDIAGTGTKGLTLIMVFQLP